MFVDCFDRPLETGDRVWCAVSSDPDRMDTKFCVATVHILTGSHACISLNDKISSFMLPPETSKCLALYTRGDEPRTCLKGLKGGSGSEHILLATDSTPVNCDGFSLSRIKLCRVAYWQTGNNEYNDAVIVSPYKGLIKYQYSTHFDTPYVVIDPEEIVQLKLTSDLDQHFIKEPL